MNREIEFRGKRADNGKWVCGNIQVPKHPFNEYYMWDDLIQCKVDSKTVGQYTGLKDKNGKKIYEGDILAGGHTGKYEVMYLNAAFKIVDLHNAYIYEPQYVEYLTVIGNIHDNPELLNPTTYETD